MAHPSLIDWLAARPLAGRILVPGCGLGHDVRAIAEGGAEVIGFDLSPTAIAQADRLPKTGKETYRQGDFFAPPDEWTGAFDVLFEHTCFCAIDPGQRDDYVKAATRLLRPGGRLLGIFFLNPGVETGPPFGCTVEELQQRFGGQFHLQCLHPDIPTYPNREGQEVLCLFIRR